MKPCLLSLAVGLFVGVIYALFDVRSPAPPVIALVGLLGILAGEQIPPRVRQLMQQQRSAPAKTWPHAQVKPPMSGQRPRCPAAPEAAASAHPQQHPGEPPHG